MRRDATRPLLMMTASNLALADRRRVDRLVSARSILALHPEDAKVVREHLGEQLNADGWRIVEDATLLRGGCWLRTTATQVDATLAARWRHLATALGQDAKWLD